MMTDGLRPCSLKLLHRIVQEEINQNGVYFCVGMLLQDFPPQQLDTPDTAG